VSDGRSILNLDMSAFFAGEEMREDQWLRGKPLLIGHDGPRGVVATASYEARPFGCHSAQPMAVAKRNCPHAIILPVRMSLYRQVSDEMFAILGEFSPAIEPLSIDEAFVDLTGTHRLLGEPEAVARRIKERIKSDLKLTASVGLAPNKFLAKLASDLNKPDGLTVIRPEDVDRVLPALPVTKIWGVGKATAERMRTYGIRTIGDLRSKSEAWLDEFFGGESQRYYQLARGVDERPVVGDEDARSISHEQTFEADVPDAAEVRAVMLDQVEQVGARLRRHGLLARGVSLKIRFGNFQTISRSTTLPRATDATAELWEAARDLFDRWPFQPVRLIGVAAERLSRGEGQLDLFSDARHDRRRKLDDAADQINQRFGKRAIRRAGPG
jgi:DNA polymerase-4